MTVAELIVRIGAETTGLQRGLRQAETQLKGFQRIGNGLASVGSSMSKYVTLPILVAAGASAKFAIDFQQQMEMIHTQAGASQGEVDRLSAAVLKLGENSVQGPSELAQGLFHIESVGMRGAKAMDVLKAASLGAQVGQTKLEDTASALAAVTLTNIKGTQNYQHAMGVLNATIGAGNMRMTDLLEALKSGIVPTAKVAGLSLTGLTASLAMMTDEGVPAGVAANRLRTALLMMTNPSQKAQTTLKALGMTTLQMGHDLSKPDGLVVALSDLRQHMEKIHDPAKRLQLIGNLFGGSRSAGTIALLMNNLDRVGMKFRQITKTAGNFGKDVAASNQTAAVKLHKAWSAVQVAMIHIGAVVVPILLQLAQYVARVADAFSHLSPAAQHWIVVGLAIVATVGPILFMFGKMIVLGYQVATVLEAVGAAGLIAFGWAALIIAVIAALVIAYKKVGWFHHAVNVAFHAIEAVVRTVVSFIGRYWKVTMEVMLAPLLVLVGAVINHWNGIKNAASAAFSFIGDHWRLIIQGMLPVVGTVIVAIIDHWNTLKGAATTVWGAIRDAIGWVVDKLQAVVSWIGKIHWPSPPGWLSSIGGGISSAFHSGASIFGATGGIVTRPTMATIGEAGPEAVIPLNRAAGASPLPGGGVGGVTVIIQSPTFLTGDRHTARQLARLLAPELGRIRTVGAA